MKDAYYFSHDSNARNDRKTSALILSYGMAGYGMWWILVEMLREEEDYKIPLDDLTYAALAKEMMVTPEEVKEFIKDCIEKFKLLESDGEYCWSNSMLRRMQKLEETREKRKAAAEKRWSANAEQKEDEQCKSNASAKQKQSNEMQSKVKESKVKENKRTSSGTSSRSVSGKGKQPLPEEDKELYHKIKEAFLSQNDTFTNWQKEGESIKRLVKTAKARSPDNPETFIHQMIEKFWQLKQSGDKFWKGHPFTPSALSSAGIFDRVLEQFREEEIPEELQQYYTEMAQ